MHWDKSEIFKISPFYDTYIKRSKIKKLSSVELLKELPFYDDLSIAKNKLYVQSYKTEIVDRKDVIVKLKASKISMKDFLKDLFIELKGFKYQLTLCVLLSKVK